jgi:putative phosphoesterase
VKVAALFDVHGNLPALEAVLADPRFGEADTVVSGGDLVAGPYAAECLDLLAGVGDRVRFLAGNAEREVVERSPAHGGAWSADRLGADRLGVVAAWPMTFEIDVRGLGPVLFCHATPRRDDEILTRLTPGHEVVDALADTDAAVVVCGHTHVQFDRVVGGRRLVNPGSVGMPYEGEPGAFWALLGRSGVELVSTPYDVAGAAEALRSTGSPMVEEFVGYLLEPPDPDETSAYFEGLRGA